MQVPASKTELLQGRALVDVKIHPEDKERLIAHDGIFEALSYE